FSLPVELTQYSAPRLAAGDVSTTTICFPLPPSLPSPPPFHRIRIQTPTLAVSVLGP
uniref:Uncharacterized protein n=1 Tax=Oryza glaberrima TaxID=4538 RepID=I1NRK7_ORYGL